jgi:hypothetical protein
MVNRAQGRYSPSGMGEHIERAGSRTARITPKRPGKQSSAATSRRLLEIVVYDKCCGVGGTLSLNDLAGTEIGDWTMPAFRAACRSAASQGWLTVHDDTVTLTIAGLRAA